MSLTVLNVAYPLAPVTPDAAGGAEQVLGLIDEALVRAGHRSIVLACEGSAVRGKLIATPKVQGLLDDAACHRAREYHRRAIEEALRRWDVDLVHLHGIDFNHYLPPPGTPVIVTLHLPPGWYDRDALLTDRPGTYFHCVSASQRAACPQGMSLLPDIENGVPVERLETPVSKRRFALAVGRICPEKGFHIALNAARSANVPLILAGEVFRYEAHERYFINMILPRLEDKRRVFIGPLDFERKRRFLSAARCLLVPSLAPETSSLVAMEALACGTPVIAFPSGALAQIVEHGKTGFLVNDEQEMAEAMIAAAVIDPEVCREVARRRFSAERMTQHYIEQYRKLIEGA
ncbi:MAG: glycosyltransferase family 4 protein [Nitrospirota bacterium]